jgi:patatin-like phospholipase/acyl hydrolase
MDRYRILSLDGGGSWALIQVKALIELYGANALGRELLQEFNLVAANSGGSIVLGCLLENFTLAQSSPSSTMKGRGRQSSPLPIQLGTASCTT